MSKVIMLVGLPASGKSTYAESLSKQESAKILSSDEMRLEIFGNVEHQDDNHILFQELYKRTKQLLLDEKNVIIDSTNVSSKRRISFNKDFQDFEREVHYIAKNFYECVYHDEQRDRTVGYDVIKRMYESLTIPTYAEGWNTIKLINQNKNTLNTRDYFEDILVNGNQTHDELFGSLLLYKAFADIYDLPHDSKWHSLSVSRHTYEVWKHTLVNYNGQDKMKMLLAAIFHDTGKSFCKKFKGNSKYASFISHENVSGQLCCDLLQKLGYEDEFVLQVVELVQLHMRLLSVGDSDKGKKKLVNFVGEEVFNDLVFLREADLQAH